MKNRIASHSDEISRSIYHYGICLIGLLLIAVSIYCRIRLLDVPLERDEGGFAYIGQQILRGVAPYLSGNMKVLPGIHYAYAAIMMLFGERPAGIHLGLMVINILTVALLFLLARRMLSVKASVLAAGVFAIVSVSQSVFGVFAHATHFVLLFTLEGLLLLLKGIKIKQSRYIFLAGVFLGTSVLMKQHGVFFCFLGIYYLSAVAIKQKESFKKFLFQLAILLIGMSIPYAVICFYMYHQGVFNDFWFWTFTRSLKYAAADGSIYWLSNLRNFYHYVTLDILCFLLLSLAGLALTLFRNSRVHNRQFLISFLLLSLLAVLPGFYFYPHYFVLLIPSLSLLAAVFADSLPNIMLSNSLKSYARKAVVALILSITVFSLYSSSGYLFKLTPEAVSRSIYGLNPFPESLVIAEYIKENSSQGDKIAVLGSEPQIYFYADRPSATDYLYMYPLVKQQEYAEMMQKEMIAQIEASAPKYIVFALIPTSWMFDGNSGVMLQLWIEDYLRDNYQQVGVVELRYYGNTVYYWGKDAYNRMSDSDRSVLIFRKKLER